MRCGKCNLNKIGPRTVPFGGYMCSNDHLQCSECNMKSQGQCTICNNYTNFVEMKMNPPSHHSGTMKSKIGDATKQPSGNAFTASELYFSKTSHDHVKSEMGISQEQQTLSAFADLFEANDEEDVKGTLNGKNKEVGFNPKDGEPEKIEQCLVNESDVKPQQSVDVFQKSFNKTTTKFQSNTEKSRIPKLLRPTSLATLRPNHNKSEESKIAKGTDDDHKELPQPVQSSIKLKESNIDKVTDEHQLQIPHRIDSAVHCHQDSASEEGTQSNENVLLFDEVSKRSMDLKYYETLANN